MCNKHCFLQASLEARDMALGMFQQDAVHPLNPDMVGSSSSVKLMHQRVHAAQWQTDTLMCVLAEEDS